MSRRCTAEELKGLPPVPEGAQAVMLQKGDAVPLFALWPADGEWRSGVRRPGSTVPAETPALVPRLAPSWMRVDSKQSRAWYAREADYAEAPVRCLTYTVSGSVMEGHCAAHSGHLWAASLKGTDATHIMPLPAAPEVEA
jgi:hypothetical protein